MLFSNTPSSAEHSLDRHSCTRPLREFIFSELPRQHHIFTFTFTSAPPNRFRWRNFDIPWPRTLSHLPATSTHGLRRNHTCNRSPRRHSFRFYMHQAHHHPCFRTPFPSLTTSIWKSETQSQPSSMCSSTQLSCGPHLWPPTTQSSVHTHTDP